MSHEPRPSDNLVQKHVARPAALTTCPIGLIAEACGVDLATAHSWVWTLRQMVDGWPLDEAVERLGERILGEVGFDGLVMFVGLVEAAIWRGDIAAPEVLP